MQRQILYLYDIQFSLEHFQQKNVRVKYFAPGGPGPTQACVRTGWASLLWPLYWGYHGYSQTSCSFLYLMIYIWSVMKKNRYTKVLPVKSSNQSEILLKYITLESGGFQPKWICPSRNRRNLIYLQNHEWSVVSIMKG